MHVVVADDMSPPRNRAKRILRDAGYDVVGEASDGLVAIKLCKELKPDLVLLDISMPVLPGDVAAKELLGSDRRPPQCEAQRKAPHWRWLRLPRMYDLSDGRRIQCQYFRRDGRSEQRNDHLATTGGRLRER
jgi:hypothetical protein